MFSNCFQMNRANKTGDTPFHCLVKNRDCKMAKEFLEHGMYINVTNCQQFGAIAIIKSIKTFNYIIAYRIDVLLLTSIFRHFLSLLA